MVQVVSENAMLDVSHSRSIYALYRATSAFPALSSLTANLTVYFRKLMRHALKQYIGSFVHIPSGHLDSTSTIMSGCNFCNSGFVTMPDGSKSNCPNCNNAYVKSVNFPTLFPQATSIWNGNGGAHMKAGFTSFEDIYIAKPAS